MVASTRTMIKDATWVVNRSFLVNGTDIDLSTEGRFISTAAFKFTDTSPGGNYEVNPLPQFTQYCDLPPPTGQGKGRATSPALWATRGAPGLGSFYSEAFDDSSQRIHIRFGVPQFNSLSTFFMGFYNTSAGRLARTGRSPGIVFNLGKLVGMVVPLCFPLLLMSSIVGAGARFFSGKQISKYYFLKPTMPLYWHAVQTILNGIAVNVGIVPRIIGDPEKDKNMAALNPEYQFGTTYQEALANIVPDIFDAGGTINVYALATKAQRLARAQEEMLKTISDQDHGSAAANMAAMMRAYDPRQLIELTDQQRQPWESYINNWISGANLGSDGENGTSSIPWQLKDVPTSAADVNSADAKGKGGGADAYEYYDRTKFDPKKDPGFKDFFMAELDDGAAFATFRVNYTGSVNESFSNSTRESDIANKINSQSASGRATAFSFAGGSLGDENGNLLQRAGALITGAIKTASDLFAGIGEGLGVSGLGVLAGGALVDIPKHWESSSARLPTANYTMTLSSPYNNPFSRLINIYLPTAMVLAGALPLSTGKQSYTSPLLCEYYDKGRSQSRLAIFESLQLTRGTGNIGFTPDGVALGYELSFGLQDLSSIMHMPISAAMSNGIIDGVVDAVATATSIFDDQTVFSDYLAVLASMNLKDQIYGIPKLKMRLTNLKANWNTWFSAAHFASMMGDSVVGKVAYSFFRGTIK